MNFLGRHPPYPRVGCWIKSELAILPRSGWVPRSMVWLAPQASWPEGRSDLLMRVLRMIILRHFCLLQKILLLSVVLAGGWVATVGAIKLFQLVSGTKQKISLIISAWWYLFCSAWNQPPIMFFCFQVWVPGPMFRSAGRMTWTTSWPMRAWCRRSKILWGFAREDSYSEGFPAVRGWVLNYWKSCLSYLGSNVAIMQLKA